MGWAKADGAVGAGSWGTRWEGEEKVWMLVSNRMIRCEWEIVQLSALGL